MKGKGKVNPKKASTTKIGNKTNSKLAKRGKLRKGKQKKKQKENDRKMRNIPRIEPVSYKRSQTFDSEGEEAHEDDMNIDDKDYIYFTSPGRDFSFLSQIDKRLETTESKKRKRKKFEDGQTLDCEQIPRKLFAGSNGKGVRHLLPIKDKGKIIEQVVPKTINEPEEIEQPVKEDPMHELPPVTNVELFLLRRKTLAEMKEKIASYANTILANPEDNLKKLKELRMMLTTNEISSTVHKLILVSLLEIFKDTIPGYRIRVLTDKEKDHQLKKDTKNLMEYESQFLVNYKHYIEHLQNAVRRFKNSKYKHLKALPDVCKQSLFEISVKCLASLLANNPHFNYRKDLIQAVIPFMNHKKPELSTCVCEAVITVFKNDTLGESTLEIVRAIGKFIKSKDFNNIQPKVLETYLSLRITDIDKLIAETAPKKDKKNSEDMSRKERKRKKKMRVLENELLETKATEDKSKRLKLHTETLECVFHSYFRILKSASKSPLLPCVLEGLAKFAHLINIQFFNDLFVVLNQLIDSGDLAYREILHCVQSAFTILSGQGSALNIDPMTFYKHLYRCLLEVHAGTSSNDMSIILPCLYILIMKQKRKLSQQKVVAFMKRLSTMALQQLPHGALSLLAAVKQFLHAYSLSDLLFDNESQGSGIFMPELDEPEYSNAHNTMLWELQLLRRHYQSDVKVYARHLCYQAPTTGDGQLPTDLLRKNPEELFRDKKEISSLFDSLPSKPRQLKRKRTSRRGYRSEGLTDYIQTVVNNVPDVINFDRLLPSDMG
ncbi:nucleolar complex protein 3 homolog [Patella vulgata]|uniref:nucleolar complex protein 3 homolog n=1 Tax=Patella vulgata TaxID=6465 RepID=UPI00217F4E4C|nr:nucleolar complex protein 3 homolog [Patella vulgata]XP_050396219.1 nucleolar complex protein 3 homolog [Patella vulgata]XP_050396220.1 nucleolar complex protein 3 homolog [Patella vulgata]XP_050396222.1 nucleolar complex protein 3 homolog [Patella vulgata]XP_050396223.1 nucleolar complex protein 3 homolog [Patella vulgata]XP_050396224.1 nucleolar complex protein 3 homolog [Patella vulgata]XP_050396225.1 nucleolar complex protein 3 homolog [Patella vulgata]XP_050396226.1 nucleolar complex